MPAADVAAAVVAYLRSRQDVLDLVADDTTRIVRPELLPAARAAMPEAQVVVRTAGGGARYGAGTLALMDPTIYVYCYGSSRLEADSLGGAVELALTEARGTWADVQIKSASPFGVVPMTDPETQWPCAVVSAQVTVSRPTAA